MNVERVRTERGSRIEPPMNQRWSDLDKLRWQAAVVATDTGQEVVVTAGGEQVKRFGRWVDVPGSYSIRVGGSSIGSFNFGSAWTFLTGVSIGAQEQAKETT